MVLAGCYGGWRPKSCEILYHLNWLKICGWRFGRAIGVLDIEKKSVFPFADFFWSEQKVNVATCRSGGPSAPRLLCHQRHLKVSNSSENIQIIKNIQKLFRGLSIWKSLQDSFVLFWLGSKNMIGFCVNYRSSSFPHAPSLNKETNFTFTICQRRKYSLTSHIWERQAETFGNLSICDARQDRASVWDFEKEARKCSKAKKRKTDRKSAGSHSSLPIGCTAAAVSSSFCLNK